jgi:hypothetical protein
MGVTVQSVSPGTYKSGVSIAAIPRHSVSAEVGGVAGPMIRLRWSNRWAYVAMSASVVAIEMTALGPTASGHVRKFQSWPGTRVHNPRSTIKRLH